MQRIEKKDFIASQGEDVYNQFLSSGRPSEAQGGYSVSETVGDIGEIVKGIGSTWGQAGSDIATRVTGGKVSEADTVYNPRNLASVLETGLEVGSDIVRGVGRTFDELYLGAGKVALTQERENQVKDTVVNFATDVMESDAAQSVVAGFESLDPETQNALATTGGYLEGFLELVPAISAKKLFNHVKTGNMSLAQVDNLGKYVDDIGKRAAGAAPEGTLVKEVGQEVSSRAKRAWDDVAEGVANKKALAAELADKSPSYAEARRVGWTPQELSTVVDADDVTRAGMKDIKFIGEGGPSVTRGQRATDIAGDYMEDIYKKIDGRRSDVGKELGDAIKALPDTRVNMQPAYNQIDDLLQQNGVIVRNGRFIDAPNYTEAQAKVIREAYQKFQGDELLDATSIHSKDRLFGKLQRESYEMLDKQPVMVTTSRGDEVDLMTLMRDAYRTPLDIIDDGNISELNKSYALARNASDDISNTVRKEMRNLNIPVDQGAKTGNLLRRIDSRAVSADDFKAVVDASYIRARALGYEGADPTALIQFTDDIAPLYKTPAAQPRTGFMGSIKGAIGDILPSGAPDAQNKARAVANLLDELDTPAKQAAQTPTGVRQAVSSLDNTPVSANDAKIRKLLTKERGAVGEPSLKELSGAAKREIAKAEKAIAKNKTKLAKKVNLSDARIKQLQAQIDNYDTQIKEINDFVARQKEPAVFTGSPQEAAAKQQVQTPSGVVKGIDNATKEELLEIVEYIRSKKPYNRKIETNIAKHLDKYGYSSELSNAKIATAFEKLVDNTKTLDALPGSVRG